MAGHGDVSGVAEWEYLEGVKATTSRNNFNPRGPRELQSGADLIGFTDVNDAMAPLAGLRCCLHWVLRQPAEVLGRTGKWVPAGTSTGNEMDFLETARMACSSK